MVHVFGIAAGTGSTAEAARGAMTSRAYASQDAVPWHDWLYIITINEAD